MYNSTICKRCNGQGYLLVEDANGHEYEKTCPACDGMGEEKQEEENV